MKFPPYVVIKQPISDDCMRRIFAHLVTGLTDPTVDPESAYAQALNVGLSMVHIIKLIRDDTNCGLRAAKDCADEIVESIRKVLQR
jgi:hypothetical protein